MITCDMVEIAHERVNCTPGLIRFGFRLAKRRRIVGERSLYQMWKNDAEKEGWVVKTDDGIYMNPA